MLLHNFAVKSHIYDVIISSSTDFCLKIILILLIFHLLTNRFVALQTILSPIAKKYPPSAAYRRMFLKTLLNKVSIFVNIGTNLYVNTTFHHDHYDTPLCVMSIINDTPLVWP